MSRMAQWPGKIGGENHLLAALPDAAYQRLRPHLEPMPVALGQVLYHTAQPQDYLYFPTSTLVALLQTLDDGMTAQAGITGNEGVVGIAVFLGGETTPNHAIAQIAGTAIRVPARVIHAEFNRGGTFQHLLLRYTQRSLPRSRRPRFATGCTRSNNAFAAGCCSATTKSSRMTSDHPGTDRQYPGRAAGECDGGGGSIARCRPHPLHARPYHDPDRAGLEAMRVNVMAWSKTNMRGCWRRPKRRQTAAFARPARWLCQQTAEKRPQLIEIIQAREIHVLADVYFFAVGTPPDAEDHHRHLRCQFRRPRVSAGCFAPLHRVAVHADEHEVGRLADGAHDGIGLIAGRLDPIAVGGE